jgi:hypothetical protein
MLALHLLLAPLLRQLLGSHNGAPGFFRKQLGSWVHEDLPLWVGCQNRMAVVRRRRRGEPNRFRRSSSLK